jgi:hypothetical protein
MRYTHTTPSTYSYRGERVYDLWESANIFSVKIAASDVCFPLEVYGTVIARDCLDFKCVYLFGRPREDCQVIHSEVAHFYSEDHTCFEAVISHSMATNSFFFCLFIRLTSFSQLFTGNKLCGI